MAERTLQAAEQWAAVIASSDDAIVTKTIDGALVTWNAAAERLYGYTAAEVIGRPAGILTPASLRGEEAHILERVLAGERVQHYETRQVRSDGSLVDVSLTASPVRDDDGRIVGASTIARDITKPKAVEAQLQALREELEARNAALERSNRDLANFASVASHDLSEPLRAISGFLELLVRRSGAQLDQDGQRYIRQAVDGASRMRSLIDDLLRYARVDDEGDDHTQAVDCSGLLDEVEAQLAPALSEAGAEIRRDPLPTIQGHRCQLGQVFQNLVANAVKFRGDDRPVVWVSAARCPGGWRFSVADNGIGIDTKYARRIFEPFKRLHTREAYSGTGIGLALCKRIVERHDGTIGFQPRPGGGSTFTFTIPDTEGRTT